MATTHEQSASRLAMGVDWGVTPRLETHGNKEYTQWRCDRFSTRKLCDVKDATMNQTEGSSTSVDDLQKTLVQIKEDKVMCEATITKIIKNLFVSLANACGLRVSVATQGTSRLCASTRDLVKAMRELPENDRLDLLQFITNYAGGLLYENTLGVSHQEATEDAVCEILHVRLGRTRHTVGQGKKTCIGNLYGLLYNRQKQRLHTCVLRNDSAFVSIERGLVFKSANWRRNKHIYFIHEKRKNPESGRIELTRSKEKDLRCNRMFPSWKMGVIVCLHEMQLNNGKKQQRNDLWEWEGPGEQVLAQLTTQESNKNPLDTTKSRDSVITNYQANANEESDEEHDQMLADAGGYYSRNSEETSIFTNSEQDMSYPPPDGADTIREKDVLYPTNHEAQLMYEWGNGEGTIHSSVEQGLEGHNLESNIGSVEHRTRKESQQPANTSKGGGITGGTMVATEESSKEEKEGQKHREKWGDLGKVEEARNLQNNLVHGKQGQQNNDKIKWDKRIMRVHNASVTKRVTELNKKGNEVLQEFTACFAGQNEHEDANQKKPKKQKKRKGELLKVNTTGTGGKKKKKQTNRKASGTGNQNKENDEPPSVKVTAESKVCKACDHCTMIELLMMDHRYVKAYLQEGGYFDKKECKGGCGGAIQEIAKQKKSGIYYCKHDFDSETLEGDTNVEEGKCNYVICSGCRQGMMDDYDKKQQKEGGRVVRSKRNRKPKNK